MKNVLKISLAALTFSLIMMLSPTQINASYMISGPECTAGLGGASCECDDGQNCEAGLIKCKCKTPKN
jgi:hypothetical protein